MKKRAVIFLLLFLTGCKEETAQVVVNVEETVVKNDYVGEIKNEPNTESEPVGTREEKAFEDLIFDISTEVK